ncbi:MAG TPA: tyrosine-type recombinase/integrase [Acidimicrobiales bacterium]|nr:tyrosine-type recombinase/integrase [Acidimicrobiales bacterium]
MPKALDHRQVASLLRSCDRRTGVGRRDFAIITVLWRLGLRAGEVARLSLDDMDWATGEFVVTCRFMSTRTWPLKSGHWRAQRRPEQHQAATGPMTRSSPSSRASDYAELLDKILACQLASSSFLGIIRSSA